MASRPAPPLPMDAEDVEIGPPSLPLACPPDPPPPPACSPAPLPLMASRPAPPSPMVSPQAHRHAQVVEVRAPSPSMEASGGSFRPPADPHPTYGFGLTGYGDGIPYQLQYTAAPVTGFGYGGSFLDLMATVSARDGCHNGRPHGNNQNQDWRDNFAKTTETVIIADANPIPVEKGTGSNKVSWECNVDTSFPIMEDAHFDGTDDGGIEEDDGDDEYSADEYDGSYYNDTDEDQGISVGYCSSMDDGHMRWST